MTELSALGIKVTSDGVVKTTGELERFAKASNAARAAAKPINVKVGVAGLAKATSDLQKMQKAMSSLGGGSSANVKITGVSNAVKDVQRLSTSVAATNTASLTLDRAMSGVTSSASEMAAKINQVDTALKNEAISAIKAGQSMQQANAHVQAYKNSLSGIPASAQAAEDSIQGMAQGVRDSTNAMQATPGNIAAQFQDIGVTAAAGMNPLLIALQQGTQLSAEFAGGGLSKLGEALKQTFSLTSILTIGVVTLVAVLVQWGISMLGVDSATKKANESIKDLDRQFNFATISAKQLREVNELLAEANGKVERTALQAATATWQQASANRDAAKSELELANAAYQRIAAFASDPTFAEGNLSYAWQLGDLKKKIDETTKAVEGFDRQARAASFDARILTAGFDEGAKKAEFYRSRINQLREAYKNMPDPALMEGIIKEAEIFQKRLDAIKPDESAAKKAQRASESAAKKAQRASESAAKRYARDAMREQERANDILRNAQNEIDAQKRRAEAGGLSAQAAAESEQQQSLLNRATEAGIPLTDGLILEIDRLSKSFAEAKIAADVAEVIQSTNESIEKQKRAIADDVAVIGLYGDELLRARKEQELLNAARDALPRGAALPEGEEERIRGEAADIAGRMSLAEIQKRDEALRKSAESAKYAMDLEREGLYLTGKEAIAHSYAMEKLNAEYERAGFVSAEYAAAVRRNADVFAEQRYEIDRTRKAIEESREITKGFFTDWINQVREGGNAFKAFANIVVDSLNRIIDKMMDNAWEAAFANMNGGGGGGFLGGIVGGISSPLGGGRNPYGVKGGNIYAKGGAFANDNEVMRFAKGGAFTNSIVSRPTMFQFANGGAFGEMGEAGPEAIMPLKRGPDGSLGVEAHGGRSVNNNVTVENTYNIGGVMTPEAIIAAIRQGGEETMRAVQRQLPTIMNEYDRNGAVAA